MTIPRTARRSDEKLKGQQRKCFSLLLSLLLSVGDNEGHEKLK
jgi:hypothetical protein